MHRGPSSLAFCILTCVEACYATPLRTRVSLKARKNATEHPFFQCLSGNRQVRLRRLRERGTSVSSEVPRGSDVPERLQLPDGAEGPALSGEPPNLPLPGTGCQGAGDGDPYKSSHLETEGPNLLAKNTRSPGITWSIASEPRLSFFHRQLETLCRVSSHRENGGGSFLQVWPFLRVRETYGCGAWHPEPG